MRKYLLEAGVVTFGLVFYLISLQDQWFVFDNQEQLNEIWKSFDTSFFGRASSPVSVVDYHWPPQWLGCIFSLLLFVIPLSIVYSLIKDDDNKAI